MSCQCEVGAWDLALVVLQMLRWSSEESSSWSAPLCCVMSWLIYRLFFTQGLMFLTGKALGEGMLLYSDYLIDRHEEMLSEICPLWHIALCQRVQIKEVTSSGMLPCAREAGLVKNSQLCHTIQKICRSITTKVTYTIILIIGSSLRSFSIQIYIGTICFNVCILNLKC